MKMTNQFQNHQDKFITETLESSCHDEQYVMLLFESAYVGDFPFFQT